MKGKPREEVKEKLKKIDRRYKILFAVLDGAKAFALGLLTIYYAYIGELACVAILSIMLAVYAAAGWIRGDK